MRVCLLVCGLVLGLIGATPAVAGRQIDAAELEALRVAGTTEIVPDDDAVAAIDGAEDKLVTEVKVCITSRGKVKSVEILASSGVAPYDAQIERTVKASWRFRPYKRKKKAIAVCATAVLTYQPPPPPPPPPPPKAESVSPAALEAIRITGDKNIVPDDATKVDIQKAGKSRLVIPVKLCITDSGAVKSVTMLKSSGFPAYDAKIKATIATWTYQPFIVNGVARAVCSAITFIYVQRS